MLNKIGLSCVEILARISNVSILAKVVLIDDCKGRKFMDRHDLKRLLGPDMAQDDLYYTKYSVERPKLLKLLRSDDESFLIVNAPRGSGKSGLILDHRADIQKISAQSSRVITKYYSDIVLPEESDLSVNQYLNFWKNQMLGWIGDEIGKSIGFATRADELDVIDHSKGRGVVEEGTVSTLLRRVKFNQIPIELTSFDPNLKGEQVKRLIDRSKLKFWILLDEMDDHYTNSYSSNNALVGLIQACNYISNVSPRVMVRMTIRPHIMTILRNNFDIVQKFKSNEVKISWSPDEFVKILSQRINYFERETKEFDLDLFAELQKRNADAQRKRERDNVSRYFADFDLSFSNGKTSRYRALHTLALRRPRWLIEFCRLALSQSEVSYADINEYKKAMYEYGSNRIQFLSGEHKFHMPELPVILARLASLRKVRFGRSGKLKELIITEIIDRGLDGRSGEDASESEKEERALNVAKNLFMVDFIRAKQSHGGRGRHRFFDFNDRPSLLDSWADDKTIQWEMHPTFSRGYNLEDTNVYRSGDVIKLFGEKGR